VVFQKNYVRLVVFVRVVRDGALRVRKGVRTGRIDVASFCIVLHTMSRRVKITMEIGIEI
jgi:hypothetical protein